MMGYKRPEWKRKNSFVIVADEGGGGTVVSTPTPIIEPLPPPETTGTKSVLGEILEAFDEISYSFNGMAKAFDNFGNVIETESENLGIQMKSSITNIKNNVDNVVSKFGNMGKNLAANFT